MESERDGECNLREKIRERPGEEERKRWEGEGGEGKREEGSGKRNINE
jgi:hypothetical protein